MVLRNIEKMVRGQRTMDGAGVHLMRVLGNQTAEDFDPFLMLDSFDSKDPADYVMGFPFHPHRGIETFSYLVSGEMAHKDSMGNVGTVTPGGGQWMSAGSGIMHEEMPQPSERMLGFQLWVNLPAAHKMDMPAYHSLQESDFPVLKQGQAAIRVLSGSYHHGNHEVKGFQPQYVQADIYDVMLPAGQTVELESRPNDNVFVFLMEGDAQIMGQAVAEKTAVLFGPGDGVQVTAQKEPLRFIYFGAAALEESVAWGGPIVMNTQRELQQAFEELQEGNFVKHKIHMDK